MEALFFWIFAVGLVGAALAVVLNRNPVASALCLVGTFVFLAALFVTLEAFFLAAVQIIVYAGAVMVLFLFIIMLLDIKAEAKRPVPYGKICGVLLLSVIFALFFDQVLTALPAGQSILKWSGEISSDAKGIGMILFSRYTLPFAITAVLLLVATLGVILLSKREVK
ncbi:MAG: NADH-quinone oxidoreductase subunit J [Blastochloris sp.]|nr:NADH-quinone oxidoreductase subunit J [Blastochloris sp.]